MNKKVVDHLSTVLQKEEDGATDYFYNLDLKLSVVKKKLSSTDKKSDNADLIPQLVNAFKRSTPKVQDVKLPVFSGTSKDTHTFSEFITQFKDSIKDETIE